MKICDKMLMPQSNNSKEKMLRDETQQKLTATGSGLAVMVAAGLLFQASIGQAQTPTFDPAKVLKGMQIAPVPLNMQGKDPNMVGYGSYLVNAVGDCNGCHSTRPPTALTPVAN